MWQKTVLLLCLSIVLTINATKISLNKNENYDNILVVIGEDVPEDFQLVEKLKKTFQVGSDILRAATREVGGFGKSFGMGTIHILVPKHWHSVSVAKPSWEREDIRDYSITLNGLGDGGRPRAIQPYGCGVPALYSVMSAQYTRSTDISRLATEVVHEFAHLRFGVFDEFNRYGPHWYYNGNKILPVRCTAGIKGIFVNQTTGGDCKIDPVTNSLGPECIFAPDSAQDADVKASIMFVTYISSLQHFCSARHPGASFEHDKLAPNPQNRNCYGASVQEIMSRHSDFTNSAHNNASLSNTTVNFVVVRQLDQKKVVLVFDVSSSMSANQRLEKLKIGAKYLINNLPLDTEVGMIAFGTTSQVIRDVQPIVNQNVRNDYLAAIDNLQTSGWTCIGCGLLDALQIASVNLDKPSIETNGFLMLFSDGEDNKESHKYVQAVNILYNTSLTLDAISISNQADHRLSEMASKTGGKNIFLSDKTNLNQTESFIDELLKGRFIKSKRTEDPNKESKTENSDVEIRNVAFEIEDDSESHYSVAFNTISLYAHVNATKIENLTASTVVAVTAFFMNGPNFVVVTGADLTGEIYADTNLNVPKLNLRDDGNGADNEANDGVYSAYILPSYIQTPQKYGVRVKSSKPHTLEANTDMFEVIGNKNPDKLIQPPARITTLSAKLNMETISLSLKWKAVGNEQDIGIANNYIIRISENHTALTNNFSSGLLMPVNPDPLPSGEEMSTILNATHISLRNTTFYVGVVANSTTGLQSDVSNLEAALFIDAIIPDEFNRTITTTLEPSTDENTESTSEITQLTDVTKSTNEITQPTENTKSTNEITQPTENTESTNEITQPTDVTKSTNEITQPTENTESTNEITQPTELTNKITQPTENTESTNEITITSEGPETTETTPEITKSSSVTTTTTTEAPPIGPLGKLTNNEKILVGTSVGLGIIVLICFFYICYTCSKKSSNVVESYPMGENNLHIQSTRRLSRN